MLKEILLETILDTAKMLPFLFVAYVLIEWIEHKAGEKITKKLHNAGKYGSIAGAVLGCVPQCGFSVAAAKLYDAGVITVGSLMAVFLSTSDEALPVLFAHPGSAKTISRLLVCKVAVAMIAGLLADLVMGIRSYLKKQDGHEANHHHSDVCHCHCEEGHWMKSVVRNTVKTTLFLFVVSLLLECAITLAGEETIKSMLLAETVWQPFLCALIGFIPNCAASVILTDLYLEGGISFGATLAGLCTGAGVGLAVLYKNRNVKRTLLICSALYAVSVLAGILADLIF